MADRKDRMALLSRYSKLHTQHYGTKPVINMNVEQWASDALVESYTLHGCYDLLEYYFGVSSNPSWSYFAYNADSIYNAIESKKKDDHERAERRMLAKKWLNE